MTDQDQFDSSKTMSEEEYLNMVFSHLEEALRCKDAAHILRLRTSAKGPFANVTPEALAQRKAIGELAARLLETEMEAAMALGLRQYELYLKAKGKV
jgi:hypothetical protein